MYIVVLNGSARANGNTAAHVKAFEEGAEKAGHSVEVIPVGRMNINGCKGCMYCKGEGQGKCIQQDDMQAIYPALARADMVVFASPVYYWGFSGQIQSTITRFFAVGKPAASKYAMLISSGSPDVYDAILAQYKSMLSFFGAEDVGTLLINGEDNSSEETLKKMREFGESL